MSQLGCEEFPILFRRSLFFPFVHSVRPARRLARAASLGLRRQSNYAPPENFLGRIVLKIGGSFSYLQRFQCWWSAPRMILRSYEKYIISLGSLTGRLGLRWAPELIG